MSAPATVKETTTSQSQSQTTVNSATISTTTSIPTTSSSSSNHHPPRQVERRILTADYDDEGVYVYQAYKPSIGLEAVKNQSFANIPDFSPTRMTWIKFSLGWMLYRCDYARSRNQEVVLRIKLSYHAFWTILRAGVGSFFDQSLYADQKEWNRAMENSEVRWQWDPERDIRIVKLPFNQRALQLGLKKEIGRSYATDPKWILKIENYTEMAQKIRHAMDHNEPLPVVPVEREFPITDPTLRASLGMDSTGEQVHEPVAPKSKSKKSKQVAPVASASADKDEAVESKELPDEAESKEEQE